MQTMLERIAEAEQQADAIIEKANSEARDRIAAARAEADASFAAARDSERDQTVEALATARQQGDQMAEKRKKGSGIYDRAHETPEPCCDAGG